MEKYKIKLNVSNAVLETTNNIVPMVSISAY
jgi:hypothetical protein